MAKSEYSYGFTRASIMKRYATHIEGPDSAFFLVVAAAPLGQQTRDALGKTALALGWQEGPTYLWIGANTASEDDAGTALSADDLFEAVEGLDPICVVLVGRETQELAKNAFRQDIPAQGRFRLFGRDACAFGSLETMLQTDAGKKTVWALLRGLPHAL